MMLLGLCGVHIWILENDLLTLSAAVVTLETLFYRRDLGLQAV